MSSTCVPPIKKKKKTFYFYSTPLFPTIMSKKTSKRKRGERPMIDGEIDSAMVVTPETIFKTKKDGSTVTKQVWVSLESPNPNIIAVENPPEMHAFDEPVDLSSPLPDTGRTYRVSSFEIGVYTLTD
jgi:hypothetical protein